MVARSNVRNRWAVAAVVGLVVAIAIIWIVVGP